MRDKPTSFMLAKHTINAYLISSMSLNEKSLTIYNRESGKGKECPLHGDTHNEIRDWYISLHFDWSEVGDVITLTWI